MPIPKPGKNESKRDFIARCMGALADEFPRQDQRYAVCNGAWTNRKKDINLITQHKPQV
jgi:hypothetical protein